MIDFSLESIEAEKKTITAADIKEALERPENCGFLYQDERLFMSMSLGPVIQHRDSTLLQESNAATVKKYIERLTNQGILGEDNIDYTSMNHWAVGWVEHLSFLVIDLEGNPTNEFAFLRLWNKALEEYPIADEDDLGMREWDFAYQSIEDTLRSKLVDNPPEDYIHQIIDELPEMPHEQYGYDDEIIEIATRLGFIEKEDE